MDVDALQQLFGGQTLAQLIGVTEDHLEKVYEQGCELVEAGKFGPALDDFLFLVVHDPYEFRFQFGYAMCLHQLGSVAEAAKHFALAWILDPSDAGCSFRLGECHAALGDRDAAREAFETAIQLCNPPDFDPRIRAAAEAGLSKLSN
jgi:type III secretion system low calcium response chaperone LcrH/SycD